MTAYLIITLALSIIFGLLNRGPVFTREGSWQKRSWRDYNKPLLLLSIVALIVEGFCVFGWQVGLATSLLAFAFINLPEALRIKQHKKETK